MLEGTQMVERMVAHLMALSLNALKELGVFPDVVAHHKEGGFDAIFAQRVQNERRSLGYGAVVEGQVDGPLVSVHTPRGPWVEPS